jgi:hypothetical protein
MRYVANARMYSVNPQATSAWKELFAWLSRESGVELDVVDHAFPLPLSDLWSRADLACAFHVRISLCADDPAATTGCSRSAKAPVPGRPVTPRVFSFGRISEYFSIEDTFDRRVGYTVEDSHSGYNALRHHLLPYYRQRGGKLYRQSIGPLTTPRRVIEALLAGDIDVGPVDGYALDLMLRHQAKLGSRIRIIATTDPAPIPFLVAASGCPDEIVSRLQAALASFAGMPACADLRDRLCLDGFAPVATGDYGLMLHWDAEARAAGYAQPI